LQMNPTYKVKIEGHTDRIGSAEYNDKLGLARANAVRDFLVKYGASASQITATSEGKANPRYAGQKNTFTPTDEARYMNRRVSLTVTDAQGKTVSADGSAG
jgi:OOP family OmpA-OmpF porin